MTAMPIPVPKKIAPLRARLTEVESWFETCVENILFGNLLV